MQLSYNNVVYTIRDDAISLSPFLTLLTTTQNYVEKQGDIYVMDETNISSADLEQYVKFLNGVDYMNKDNPFLNKGIMDFMGHHNEYRYPNVFYCGILERERYKLLSSQGCHGSLVKLTAKRHRLNHEPNTDLKNYIGGEAALYLAGYIDTYESIDEYPKSMNIADIAHSYDVPCYGIVYDGIYCWATTRAAFAIRNKHNWFEPNLLGNSNYVADLCSCSMPLKLPKTRFIVPNKKAYNDLIKDIKQRWYLLEVNLDDNIEGTFNSSEFLDEIAPYVSYNTYDNLKQGLETLEINLLDFKDEGNRHRLALEISKLEKPTLETIDHCIKTYVDNKMMTFDAELLSNGMHNMDEELDILRRYMLRMGPNFFNKLHSYITIELNMIDVIVLKAFYKKDASKVSFKQVVFNGDLVELYTKSSLVWHIPHPLH